MLFRSWEFRRQNANVGVLSYIATIFVSHISEESPITLLKFAALITVYFFFASLLYTGKFWLRLLVVVLAYAISTLLEFCVLYSLLALLHIRYDEYVANMKLYLASAAITYSLKFLLSSGIKKIHKPMVASSASIKWAPDRKSTRLNSSHMPKSRMPSSA